MFGDVSFGGYVILLVYLLLYHLNIYSINV